MTKNPITVSRKEKLKMCLGSDEREKNQLYVIVDEKTRRNFYRKRLHKSVSLSKAQNFLTS